MWNSIRIYISLACSVLLLLSFEASATSRIALVMGNSAYKNIAKLRNPVNDAELMAKTLKEAGFLVTIILDADYRTMKRSIIKFGRDLRSSSEAGLFYYAGHGIQVDGENFLVPINANIDDQDEVELEAINVNSFLKVMNRSASNVNIVVLDACRDNPYSKFRSTSRGLAPVDAPKGTYIAYSTSPGSIAADGDGKNSPYTQSLVQAMAEPGRPIEQVFKEARRSVLDKTGNKQVPWETSSITGDFFFHKTQKNVPSKNSTPIGASDVNNQLAKEVFASIINTKSESVLRAFIAQFPVSIYAKLASAQLGELKTIRTEKSALNTNEDKIGNVEVSESARSWAIAKKSNSPMLMKEFMAKFPGTQHAVLAKERLQFLKSPAHRSRNNLQELTKRAAEKWKTAQSSKSAMLMREFIEDYPRTIHAALAKERLMLLTGVVQSSQKNLKDLEKRAARRWSIAKNSRSPMLMKEFMAEFPNTKHAVLAKEKLQLMSSKTQLLDIGSNSPAN